MSNFIFIIKNNNESPETTYHAIDPLKLETMNVSNTYDQYGQQISAYDAGDHICLNTEDAEKLNKWCSEHTEDLDDEEGEIYCWIKGDIIDNNDFRYNMFKNVVSDESIIKTTCKGFNYWNGHNWQTITTELEHGEPSHSVVTDTDLIEKLNNAIENKEFVKEGFGQRIYRFEDVEVIDSAYATSFATYEITID